MIVTSKLNGEPGGLRLLEGSDHNVVAHNQIGAYGTGLAIGASSHNLVIANRLTGDNPALSIGPGRGNVAAFNTAAAYEDGIEVTSSAANTLLFANRALNSEDGIDVESASTRLFFNVADDNRDWGIEAVPGVLGIGNRASGNGQAAQCLNVPCR